MHPGFLIAAATSGAGKTTITLALLRALRNRGLRVQPFKSGPDYIDTMLHRMAADAESVNLDLFMSSPDHVRQLYDRYSASADISVVEGAMGLFDGYSKSRGSCGEVAKVLRLPVVLIVNAKAASYSVAPLIYGFAHFDSGVQIAGVIFNNVASERHYAMLRQACADTGVSCLGYMPRSPQLSIPSRHLGLTIQAQSEVETLLQTASAEIESYVDIDRLIGLT